jgi:N-acyl homoserine lactone hydrolase
MFRATNPSSLIARRPKIGPILLAVDAVMHSSMADAETREIFITDMDDEPRIRASTRKVAQIATREGVALVIYGHDSDQWPTLRHAPKYYN